MNYITYELNVASTYNLGKVCKHGMCNSWINAWNPGTYMYLLVSTVWTVNHFELTSELLKLYELVNKLP